MAVGGGASVGGRGLPDRFSLPRHPTRGESVAERIGTNLLVFYFYYSNMLGFNQRDVDEMKNMMTKNMKMEKDE